MEIRNKVLPKQTEFLSSQKKEVMMSGAFGAGKSRVLCYKAFERASIPGNVVGLCRKTSTSLKRTTLRTLLKPDGELPPVLPKGSYQHHKQDNIIKINGGGEIVYFGFDDEETVGSLNLGCCCIDEGIELNEDEYTMLLGRCRMKSDPLRQTFTATNPGTPHHFLYKRFFENINSKKQEVIKTRSRDNFFLPEDYLEVLEGFTGQRRARYVEGKWVAFEGLVYDIFNRDIHIVRRPDEKWKEIVIGVDDGYHPHPPAALKIGIDKRGGMHIMREFYKLRALQNEVVAEVLDMEGEFAIADPSAASLIAAMEAQDIIVEKANNKVLPGIFAVLNRLKPREGELPMLTVDPSCTNTIMEFESYAWKKTNAGTKDQPIKELDHTMDIARYVVMRYDAGGDINPNVYRSEKDKKKKAHLKATDKDYNSSVTKEERKRIMDDPNAWND
ncbi:MAG: phage terminase large subunit [Candidatus Peribacteraceae bacterium]|nr:phage terminase large subunit [Candidatus Peribacteraceae bacterium]